MNTQREQYQKRVAERRKESIKRMNDIANHGPNRKIRRWNLAWERGAPGRKKKDLLVKNHGTKQQQN